MLAILTRLHPDDRDGLRFDALCYGNENPFSINGLACLLKGFPQACYQNVWISRGLVHKLLASVRQWG